jgi:hypothetical protein
MFTAWGKPERRWIVTKPNRRQNKIKMDIAHYLGGVCSRLIGKSGKCLRIVHKSIGLQTMREISWTTKLKTASQRDALYRVLNNFCKQKCYLFCCPEFFSQTYCVDSQVADSACSATAYLGGVKNNIGTTGVTARVKVDDCAAMNNVSNHVTSILKWSQVKLFYSWIFQYTNRLWDFSYPNVNPGLSHCGTDIGSAC